MRWSLLHGPGYGTLSIGLMGGVLDGFKDDFSHMDDDAWMYVIVFKTHGHQHHEQHVMDEMEATSWTWTWPTLELDGMDS